MTTSPLFYRVPELAEMLKLTPGGVRRLFRSGELPAAKIGGQWVVRVAALEQHLRRQERARRTSPADAAASLIQATRPKRRTSA